MDVPHEKTNEDYLMTSHKVEEAELLDELLRMTQILGELDRRACWLEQAQRKTGGGLFASVTETSIGSRTVEEIVSAEIISTAKSVHERPKHRRMSGNLAGNTPRETQPREEECWKCTQRRECELLVVSDTFLAWLCDGCRSELSEILRPSDVDKSLIATDRHPTYPKRERRSA
jgi:hypothetical protein